MADKKATDPVTALAQQVPVEQICADAIQPAAQELGKAGVDVAKSMRLLLTAPFQLLAVGQTRYERWLKRLEEKVPAERRIPIMPSLG